MLFTVQEKAHILEHYNQTRSVRLTRRWVCTTMKRDQPHTTDVDRSQQNLRETGNLGPRRGRNRSRVSAEIDKCFNKILDKVFEVIQLLSVSHALLYIKIYEHFP